MNLEGKVVAITGSGGSLGRAVAERSAKEGAKIVLVDLSEQTAAKTIKSVNKLTPNVHFVKANVTNKEDMKKFTQESVEKFGRIDVLFNNAGIDAEVIQTAEYDEDSFKRVMEINANGVFLGMKYVLKVMQQQGSGSIINTASVHGTRGMKNRSAYVASKHAVVGLTKTAAVENAKNNIRINAIAPGPVYSEITKKVAEKLNPNNPQEHFDIMKALIPADKLGLPEDISNLVNFLASDESAFITGTVMPVDGGMMAAFYQG